LVYILLIVVAVIFFLEFRPFRRVELREWELQEDTPQLKGIHRYNVVAHIHTQFSFDSLGKPSDIKKAMEENNIHFAFITDHDNDNYRFFEDSTTFAGIEKNTPDGRLLLLGNTLPVISHPNNFEFEHYRWKGDFKEGYLYEIVNIKDGVVWSKTLSVISLLKNILILPLTRDILHKWNCLIPLEKWSKLYFERAKGLKVIGGLDIHIKLVYQEHTHGVLIPSYKSAFKWLVNKVYSKTPLSTKEDVLGAIQRGNLYLSLKGKEGDFWATNGEEIYLVGDRIPSGSTLHCKFPHKKTVKILKYENQPVVITYRDSFSFKVEREGFYHFEVYEYDFKVGDLHFGFRPVAITNLFEVANG